MKHERLTNDATDGPATDEELLQGKWTGKGVSDFPRTEELIRMIKLLNEAKKFPKTKRMYI